MGEFLSYSEEEPEPVNEFHFSQIGELEDPMKGLLEKMGDHLLEYDLIIGDDTSGRIPTLVVSEFTRLRTGERTPTYFCVPNNHGSDHEGYREKAKAYLSSILEKENPQKALLVTEYASLGGTIGRFLEWMDEVGFRPDVAIVGCSPTAYNRLKDPLEEKGQKLWVGWIAKGITTIYRNQFNGVYRHPNEPVANGRIRAFMDPTHRSWSDNQEDINKAREDVSRLSQKLNTWWNNRLPLTWES